jgi:hypothetical protein
VSEKLLQLYEDLIEMKVDLERFSKRIGKMAERASEINKEAGQPAHNSRVMPCPDFTRGEKSCLWGWNCTCGNEPCGLART